MWFAGAVLHLKAIGYIKNSMKYSFYVVTFALGLSFILKNKLLKKCGKLNTEPVSTNVMNLAL